LILKAVCRATALAVLVLLLVVSGVPQFTIASSPGRATPIQHVIIITQENHSFDSYFGTYPTANGTLVDNVTSRLAPVNGIPNGVCQTYRASCVSPHLTTAQSPENPVEGQLAYEADYSSGFPLNSGPQSMVYFDYRSVPAYWDYAEEYGLADNYFAAVLSMTTPNRLMLLTGDTPVSSNYGPPPYIGYDSTIFKQLKVAGVTWGYYDFFQGNPNPGSAYPLNYISGLNDSQDSIKDVSFLLGELSSSSGLPAVSFVNFLGNGGLSEHPPNSPSAGELEVVSLVDAVMQSGFWNSTAIFVTYDEGGGFYDHVAPPRAFSIDHNFTSPLLGLGQRVPLLVISPYSKVDHVSRLLLSPLSLLRFIGYNWGLSPLNARVADANLPTDFFNFTQSPRRPIMLGTGANSAIPYPLPLQTGSAINAGGGTAPSYWPLLLGTGLAVLVVLVVWTGFGSRKRTEAGTQVRREV